MSKRIANAELNRAKNQFLNQLSLIVDRLNGFHTQKEIAAVCGVSATTISKIKNDKKDQVTLQALMEVAKRLGLIFEVSFRGDGDSIKVRVHVEAAFEYQTRIRGHEAKIIPGLRLH
ncbi:hypothetical protein pEaSNUABM11_00125 [Erwinia phage pEa_SNUABM_11]|nr:hypothetical protein pEaSNUABM11_00125 [Erwinia phage pEa_SNUABM_11]